MDPIQPSSEVLQSELGPSGTTWDSLVSALADRYHPITVEWRRSKTDFGSVCLLKHKKRTLLYLLPEQGAFQVAVVLGERAFGLAMESGLPISIKALLQEARPYVEGRGIRFPVTASDIPTVCKLIEIKLTPK